MFKYYGAGGKEGIVLGIDSAINTVKVEADRNYRLLQSKFPQYKESIYLQSLGEEFQYIKKGGQIFEVIE